MGLSKNKNIIINVFYFSFILILVALFIRDLLNGYAKESWQITEFLINYQGGFVRRGLLGEMLLRIYNVCGINPYTAIIIVCIVAYIVLVTFFIRSFIKNGYSLFIIPFVFFLGNPIINNFWVRKDILLILVFILILHFIEKRSNIYLILVNLLLIFGILIHESIAFFTFPIVLLLLTSKNSMPKIKEKKLFLSIAISLSQLLPSFIVFLIVIMNKGSNIIAGQIWESWKHVNFPIQAEYNEHFPAAIEAISWSLMKVVSYPISTLKNFNEGIYAPIALLITFSVVYFILINSDKLNIQIFKYNSSKEVNKLNISKILIFQLITFIPLFFLGWDYGRWIFFWVTSSFSIILLVPEKKLNNILPNTFNKFVININRIMSSFLSNSKEVLILLCILIAFPSFNWSLIDSMKSSAFGIFLKAISQLIHAAIM